MSFTRSKRDHPHPEVASPGRTSRGRHDRAAGRPPAPGDSREARPRPGSRAPTSLPIWALLLLSALASAQAPVAGFLYTPVGYDRCAVTESSEFETEPVIDHFSSECPGFAGYRVYLRGGDLRTWLEIEAQGVRVQFSEGRLGPHSPGFFPYVAGSVLEWRYRIVPAGEDHVAQPYALIYRVAGQDLEDPDEENQRLLVLRLAEADTCLLGSAETNEEARELADDEARACP